ncbi:hypothetical protein FNJ84_19750 [Paracoccus sp. M683]|uniref:DUF6927 domain-containing protein n=1 Tax=Paracoccus sp. M683 TaxID=2594268 RepID=UPI001180C771|nr:hypothetical protein [Paracoccus sp. M683]TRW94276.1 hypothetical protein FNJ84_19750 [Paracoccus sp. M683]
MGWLIYPDTPACIRDEIARLCTWNSEKGRGFPVLISRKGSVWYAAVRAEPAAGRLDTGRDPTGHFETDATGGYTFAAVFLTTTSKGEWGYKDMDETSGPNQAEAPAKLLDLLSPTSAEYALAWRQRCRDHAARTNRRLKPGDVIRLTIPLRFSDGAELQTFRVAKEKWGRSNRTVFISTETGGRYSISNIMSRDWTRI